MLNRVVIHVGPAKTATTTIQHFFSANRGELLRGGIFYPPTSPDSNEGHPSLAWDILSDIKKPVAYLSKAYISWEDALKRASASGAQTMLISSEDFSLEDFDEPAWHKVNSLTEHLDVKVVFGLRDPTSIVVGGWKQAVVWGVGLGEELLDLDQAIPLISRRRRIQVKPFIELVKRCLPSATFGYFSIPIVKDTNSLLARFFRAASLPDHALAHTLQKSNPIMNVSMPDRYVYLFLRLNVILQGADPKAYSYPTNGDYKKLLIRKSVIDAMNGHELGLGPITTGIPLSKRSCKILADLQASVLSWAESQTLYGTLDDLRSDSLIATLRVQHADPLADATLVTLVTKALETHVGGTSEQVATLQGYLSKVEEARDWWRDRSDRWRKQSLEWQERAEQLETRLLAHIEAANNAHANADALGALAKEQALNEVQGHSADTERKTRWIPANVSRAILSRFYRFL